MPALAKPLHRRGGRADAGQHGEIGALDVVGEESAQARERERDRADVAGAVLANRDVHSAPFVDGTPSLSTRTAARSARPTALKAASATWCSSRPVASTWIASRPDCARLLRTCDASPGSRSSVELRRGPAAEVDRGARERVVHRHDGIAVTRDPAAVAERGVERLAEGERGVLRCVVRAGLEVARAFEDQVEAGVERELLEEVVVQTGAGRDAHARGAVEREPDGDARLRGCAHAGGPCAARGSDGRGLSSIRASASTSRSSSASSRTEMRMPVANGRTASPCRSNAS